MTFFDTNVLLCAYDRDEPERQATAASLLADTRPIVVSTQVMREFYAASRRLARPLSHDEAVGALRGLRRFAVVSLSPESVIKAAGLVPRHSLSIWDAMIVRAAIEAGCDRLLTEDMHHGLVIDGVRIENPFAES